MIVFYDSEYTTWPGAMESGWSGPGQHREIVQIGAIRFDPARLAEIDTLEIFIRPKINPQLSDYFIALTGLTQREVDEKGLPFPEAFRLFTAFIGRDANASYGGDDVIVRENLRLHGMADDFEGQDIRPWFLQHGADHGVTRQTNSGRLAAALGVPLPAGQEHNALYDVRSICAGFRFLREKGVTPPF